MQIIAIGNQKGGVGKTTTVLNLGYSLADMGNRVLMIDADPQGSLSVAAGVNDAAGASLAEVLLGDKRLQDIILDLGNGLYLAPSDVEMARAELVLVGEMSRESALKNALAPIGRRFDYVLIDLPPSLGLISINCLVAADAVLVPSPPVYLDTRALQIFLDTIGKVQEKLNTQLRIIGILPTFYDSRLLLHGEILESWENAGLPVLPVRVKRSVRYAESPIGAAPVKEYSEIHAEPYQQLAEVITNG